MLRQLDATAETRTKFGGSAAVVAAVGFWLSAGPAGIVAGALVVGTWALVDYVYAFALGQVLFVALAQTPVRPASAVAQVGLFGVLLAPSVREAPLRTLGAFAVSAAGLVGVVAGLRDVSGHLWPAMVALGVTVAFCSYGLHRYQLVTLDLVEADT